MLRPLSNSDLASCTPLLVRGNLIMETKGETSMKFKQYLGKTKDTKERIYLEGFSWDCEWYWGGGYVGNKNLLCHFDGCFLEVPDRRGHPLGNFITPWDSDKKGTVVRNGCSVWEDIKFFLDDVPEHISKNWWRIKDLYKQFYRLRDAAEVFRYGGRCTSQGRVEAEKRPDLADAINTHIKDVIIPEIIKVVVKGE